MNSTRPRQPTRSKIAIGLVFDDANRAIPRLVTSPSIGNVRDRFETTLFNAVKLNGTLFTVEQAKNENNAWFFRRSIPPATSILRVIATLIRAQGEQGWAHCS